MSRDHWLTTNADHEAESADSDELITAWDTFAESLGLDNAISLPTHPDHAIYQAWLRLVELVDQVRHREEAEAQADEYAEQERLEAEFRAGFDEGRP